MTASFNAKDCAKLFISREPQKIMPKSISGYTYKMFLCEGDTDIAVHNSIVTFDQLSGNREYESYFSSDATKRGLRARDVSCALQSQKDVLMDYSIKFKSPDCEAKFYKDGFAPASNDDFLTFRQEIYSMASRRAKGYGDKIILGIMHNGEVFEGNTIPLHFHFIAVRCD